MPKFLTEEDRQLTEKMAEAGSLPVDTFVKHRMTLLGKVNRFKLNFRKSQDAKRQWITNRDNLMAGIKRFHKSVQGKRFHRNLARFLSDRSSYYKESFDEDNQIRVALNSLKTHLIIESNYFIPDINEHLSFNEVFRLSIPIMNEIISKYESGEELDDDDYSILQDLCIKEIKN